MTRLCTFAGMLIVGWAGWFLGDAAGLDIFGSFIASGVGSLAGVWIGWKIAQRYS